MESPSAAIVRGCGGTRSALGVHLAGVGDHPDHVRHTPHPDEPGDPQRLDMVAVEARRVADVAIHGGQVARGSSLPRMWLGCVAGLTRRWRPRSVEGAATALRSFFRFVRAEGLREDRFVTARPGWCSGQPPGVTPTVAMAMAR
jgi:hypothetical protein